MKQGLLDIVKCAETFKWWYLKQSCKSEADQKMAQL